MMMVMDNDNNGDWNVVDGRGQNQHWQEPGEGQAYKLAQRGAAQRGENTKGFSWKISTWVQSGKYLNLETV